MECRKCRQTQDDTTRKGGRGPMGRGRVTHPVPLGAGQKLTVPPGLEENHVGRQAGGNAAMLGQLHCICWYTADSGSPVLVGPVQVSHSAALHAQPMLCSGSALAEQKHVLSCAICKALNVLAHCLQLSVSFSSASAEQQQVASYALSCAKLSVVANSLMALLKVQPSTPKFAPQKCTHRLASQECTNNW